MNQATTTRKLDPQAGNVTDASSRLIESLGSLYALLKQLLQVAEDKLQAMRNAKPMDLNDCTRREHGLLQKVYAVEQDRAAIIARIAQGLHCPELRQACVSELANVLPDPFKSQLRAKNVGLRELAKKLKEKNAIAARVAHDLQIHLRGIFAELARSRQETVVYGPQGQHQTNQAPKVIVDAMG